MNWNCEVIIMSGWACIDLEKLSPLTQRCIFYFDCVFLARIQSRRSLSAVCRFWVWEIVRLWRSIVPCPLPPKRTTTRPRTRAPRRAKRPKEAKVTRPQPTRAGPTLSKAYRLLLKSWAWGACRHGKRCFTRSEHATVRINVSFLTSVSVPSDWTVSSMKMERFL